MDDTDENYEQQNFHSTGESESRAEFRADLRVSPSVWLNLWLARSVSCLGLVGSLLRVAVGEVVQ